MPLRDDEVRALLRAMQLLWTVLLGGVALAAAGVVAAAQVWAPPLRHLGLTIFYTSAFLNLGALIWAFAMQYHARTAVERHQSAIARIAVAHELGRRGVVALAAGGFFAVAGAFTTGEWIHFAFLVPIFGFGLLFFPTDRRAARFLHIPDDATPPAGAHGA